MLADQPDRIESFSTSWKEYLELGEHADAFGDVNESKLLRGCNDHSCSQWNYLDRDKFSQMGA